MLTAVCQFLSASVEPFGPSKMSSNIVSRLLGHDVVVHVPLSDSSTTNQQMLYERGRAADCFTLIVEGHVKIIVSNEDFVFDGGPFMCFGVQAITNGGDRGQQQSYSDSTDHGPSSPPDVMAADRGILPYIPDFTVIPTTDLVLVRVTASQYATALRAAVLEKRLARAAEASTVTGSGDIDVFAAALSSAFESPAADMEVIGEIPMVEATSQSQLLNCRNVGNIDCNGHRSTGSRTSLCDV
jgi:hypothetical protein